MQIIDSHFIGGRRVAGAGNGGGNVIEVRSPRDGALLATIPAATAADVDAAVAAARAALPGWAATAPAARADVLARIQRAIKARSEDFAQAITREMGAPIAFSRRVQVPSPAAVFGMCAKLCADFALAEAVGHSRVLRCPVGVVAAITPWNYPLHQIAAKVAAALAAGCTVVLKPSELAPLDADLLADLLNDCGVPPGVLNVVFGDGAVAGEALAAHPGVDLVSFTGSTRAGIRVSQLAAAGLRRVALELGGKSAAIVVDGADFSRAVPAVVASCLQNAGQTCTAQTRLIVPRHRYDEAAALAVAAARGQVPGDPLLAETTLGPLASPAQRARVLADVARGIAGEGELLYRGELPAGLPAGGCYVAPVVFGGVAADATIAQEEIFGPVLSILVADDADDAVRIANATRYGLSGAVWAADDAAAEAIALRLDTGMVEVNGGGFNLYAPFGGVRQSGHGRELGRYGIEEYLVYRTLQFRSE